MEEDAVGAGLKPGEGCPAARVTISDRVSVGDPFLGIGGTHLAQCSQVTGRVFVARRA